MSSGPDGAQRSGPAVGHEDGSIAGAVQPQRQAKGRGVCALSPVCPPSEFSIPSVGRLVPREQPDTTTEIAIATGDHFMAAKLASASRFGIRQESVYAFAAISRGRTHALPSKPGLGQRKPCTGKPRVEPGDRPPSASNTTRSRIGGVAACERYHQQAARDVQFVSLAEKARWPCCGPWL